MRRSAARRDFTAPHPAPARPEPRGRAWWAIALLSLVIAAYGASYVVRGEAAFVGELAASFRARPWGIILHAALGSVTLLAGPLQLRGDLRRRHPRVHRVAGRAYVAAALGTGALGLYMSAHAFGGPVARSGFAVLALLTLATTTMGLARILAGDVEAHRAWMLRSFALIFGAVTLRIELPLLVAANAGAFAPAYRWVAWLSWAPNLAWSEWRIRASRRASLRAASAPASDTTPRRVTA